MYGAFEALAVFEEVGAVAELVLLPVSEVDVPLEVQVHSFAMSFVGVLAYLSKVNAVIVVLLPDDADSSYLLQVFFQ